MNALGRALATLALVAACTNERPAASPPQATAPTPDTSSEARREAALLRVAADSIIWRNLVPGPTVTLGPAPVAFRADARNESPAARGIPVSGALALRFVGLYGDSLELLDGGDIFVRARLALPGATGIVLRVPGMYGDPSTLVLWIVANGHATAIYNGPIADQWGDGGGATDDRASFRLVDGRPQLVLTRCTTNDDIGEDGSSRMVIALDSALVAEWSGDSIFIGRHEEPATPELLRRAGLTSCREVTRER